MSLILSGTDGLSDIDGSAATPAIRGTDANTGIFFPAADTIAFAEGGAEAMRIDSSGNVGIGTTSIISGIGLELKKSGAYLALNTTGTGFSLVRGYDNGTERWAVGQAGFGGADGLGFYTGSATERARIDSSGNFLVAQTSQSQTTLGFSVTQTGVVSTAMAASTGAANSYHLYSTGAGAYRFYVSLAGTVFATSTSISAISDERLKENVRPLDLGLNEIMALQPRRYDWKEGKGQDKKDAVGFVAQEFEQVLPNSVGVSKAGEDGIEYKNINYEELVPTLVKAIQEQQALIIQLQADVAALKGAA
jgi:hypothetical protein